MGSTSIQMDSPRFALSSWAARRIWASKARISLSLRHLSRTRYRYREQSTGSSQRLQAGMISDLRIVTGTGLQNW